MGPSQTSLTGLTKKNMFLQNNQSGSDSIEQHRWTERDGLCGTGGGVLCLTPHSIQVASVGGEVK